LACTPVSSYEVMRTAELTEPSYCKSGDSEAVYTPLEHTPCSRTPTAVSCTLEPTDTAALLFRLVDVLKPTSKATCVLMLQGTNALVSS